MSSYDNALKCRRFIRRVTFEVAEKRDIDINKAYELVFGSGFPELLQTHTEETFHYEIDHWVGWVLCSDGLEGETNKRFIKNAKLNEEQALMIAKTPKREIKPTGVDRINDPEKAGEILREWESSHNTHSYIEENKCEVILQHVDESLEDFKRKAQDFYDNMADEELIKYFASEVSNREFRFTQHKPSEMRFKVALEEIAELSEDDFTDPYELYHWVFYIANQALKGGESNE